MCPFGLFLLVCLADAELQFGRMWATYLGRPYLIHLTDVTQDRPGSDAGSHSWDDKIAGAWADLLQLAGRISEVMSGCTHSLVFPLHSD
jgi:hypothetical protein